jgi:hypothetical protein|tara:strand:- start:659 stop:796 length:138 start_codon:yes stop_codon:yes gene_type:complete
MLSKVGMVLVDRDTPEVQLIRVKMAIPKNSGMSMMEMNCLLFTNL